MKNFTTVAILSALILGVPLTQIGAQEAEIQTTSVHSEQTNRPTPQNRLRDIRETREEHKAEAMERKEDMQEQRLEHRAEAGERKGEITDEIKERISNRVANSKERMTAMVERFSNIIDKVDSRITKLTEDGVDTVEAIRLVADARTALSNAESAINSIDIATILASENIREALQESKEEVKEVKEVFRTAHTALKNAIKSLRANKDSQSE